MKMFKLNPSRFGIKETKTGHTKLTLCDLFLRLLTGSHMFHFHLYVINATTRFNKAFFFGHKATGTAVFWRSEINFWNNKIWLAASVEKTGKYLKRNQFTNLHIFKILVFFFCLFNLNQHCNFFFHYNFHLQGPNLFFFMLKRCNIKTQW